MDEVKKKNNPLFELEVGDDVPKKVNMLVEIPQGSINKYEYVTKLGIIKLDRVLYEQIPYPIEYGAIPRTWDEDEDPLDIMCLMSYPTFPGCLLSVRPIAVMKFIDSGEVDDKILCVPEKDVRFRHIKNMEDVDPHRLDEIAYFFTHYKELQYKYKKKEVGKEQSTGVKGWAGVDRAYEIIEKAVERFTNKFG